MRRWFRNSALSAARLVVALALTAAAAGSSAAQVVVVESGDSTKSDFRVNINVDNDNASGIVRFGESIVVRPGQEVRGDVVAIGGSVRTAGEIWGDCVAIGGGVQVLDGARIHGEVVSIGGKLSIEPDVEISGDAVSVWGNMDKAVEAVVGGDVVEVGGLGPIAWNAGWNNGFDGMWAFSNLARRIIWVAILLGLGALIFQVFPGQMGYLTDTIQESGLKAFLWGLLFWILWLPVVIALCITVIGIIAALGLIFLTPLIMLLGYLGAAKALGQRFTGGTGKGLTPFLVDLLALEGGVILARLIGIGGVLGFVSMILSAIAGTAIFLAMTTGIGALLLTRFRSRPAAQPPVAPAAGEQGQVAPPDPA